MSQKRRYFPQYPNPLISTVKFGSRAIYYVLSAHSYSEHVLIGEKISWPNDHAEILIWYSFSTKKDHLLDILKDVS